MKKTAFIFSLAMATLGGQAADPEPVAPPKDAVVLFDGKNTDEWKQEDGKPCHWIVKDGYMEVKGGSIITKEKYTDFQLHVEFWLPNYPAEKKGQERANSGVYLQGRYEIQVLDSYNNPTYKAGGCGSIYGQKEPDHFDQAVKPPENWNTYDITFRAPRYDAEGKMTEKPRVTVVWNGIKVHDNVEILGGTTASQGTDAKKPGPIYLQDHGCPDHYRNIWIVPVK